MQDIRHFIVRTPTATVTSGNESPAGSPRKRTHSEVLATSGAVNKLSQLDAEELWLRVKNEKRIVGKAGCWVHPNEPNPKGYVQVAKDSNKKVYTHHLAVRMVHGSDAVPTDRKQNVSHLCGRDILLQSEAPRRRVGRREPRAQELPPGSLGNMPMRLQAYFRG